MDDAEKLNKLNDRMAEIWFMVRLGRGTRQERDDARKEYWRLENITRQLSERIRGIDVQDIDSVGA